MTATRQQRHSAPPVVLSVRVSPELIDWLRTYARTQGISVNMAASQAIEALKATRNE